MLCSINSECNGTAGQTQTMCFLSGHNYPVDISTSSDSGGTTSAGLLLRWVFPLLCWYKDLSPHSLYSSILHIPKYTVTLLHRRLCFSETTAVSTWNIRFTELKFLIFLFLTFSFSLRHIPFETLRKYKITRNCSLKFVNIYFHKV